jgi:hypothetical protein
LSTPSTASETARARDLIFPVRLDPRAEGRRLTVGAAVGGRLDPAAASPSFGS